MKQSRLLLPILTLLSSPIQLCFAQFAADNNNRGPAPGAAAVRWAEAVNAGDAASRNADAARYVTSLTPGVPASVSYTHLTLPTIYSV